MPDSRPRSPVGEAIDERMARIGPATYSFDDLTRRRARKQRNSRLASAVVALALVLAVLVALRGLAAGFGAGERVPASPVITAHNANGLALAWVASSPSLAYAFAVTDGDGRVYAGFADGTVKAFPASCGSDRCAPIWSAPTVGTSLTRPTVADGIVYVASGGGTTSSTALRAYAVGCGSGGATCRPLWSGVMHGYQDSDAAPLVTADAVVVASGGLFAFPLDCAAPTCSPRWVAPLSHSIAGWLGSVGVPASLATDGRTIFAAGGANLEAFDTDCASNGNVCHALWTHRFPSPIMHSPMLADGIVYVDSGGSIFGFPTACSTRSCDPMQTTSVGATNEDPLASFAAFGNLMVAGRVNSGIVAVPAGCGSAGSKACRPVWTAKTGGAPVVTVADGLIFAAAADGVYAFDPHCGSGGATCEPLWFEPIRGAALTVGRNAVYVGSPDGRLEAFTAAGK